MKQVKKSIKSFMQDLEESKDQVLSGGFGSIKGGFKSVGPLNNTGGCDNGECNTTNSDGCTNDINCNSTNTGGCTNPFQCS